MSQDKQSTKVDDLIDQNLRRVYEDVLQEEVPDRFAQLLAQLEQGAAPAPQAEPQPAEGDDA